MTWRALILLFCFSIFVQGIDCQSTKEKTRTTTKSFRAVQRFGLDYTPKIIRVRNLKLEDIRPASEGDQTFVLQLFDSKSGFRRGEMFNGGPFHPYQFLFCVDEELARPILAEKDSWFGERVNIFFRVEDRGLTVLTSVAYILKIELLDDKGKTVKTVSF